MNNEHLVKFLSFDLSQEKTSVIFKLDTFEKTWDTIAEQQQAANTFRSLYVHDA